MQFYRTEHLPAVNYQMHKLTAADALESYDLTTLQFSSVTMQTMPRARAPQYKSPDTLQQSWQQAYHDCAGYTINATDVHAECSAFRIERPCC